MRKEGSLERTREDQGKRKPAGCKDDAHTYGAKVESGKEGC